MESSDIGGRGIAMIAATVSSSSIKSSKLPLLVQSRFDILDGIVPWPAMSDCIWTCLARDKSDQ